MAGSVVRTFGSPMAANDAAARSLITPLEPAARHGAPPVVEVGTTRQQSTYATAFCRIEAAVASSRGAHHACNEDAHSPLGGAGRLFVVADGVGGGAMAHLASQQLVAQLHQALEPHRIDAKRVRQAVLDADRRVAERLAQVTEAPGAATLALCAPMNRFASTWMVAWVGDCRVYRLAMGDRARLDLLTTDDTFRHLNEPPPRGGLLDDPARMVGNGAVDGANTALHHLACGDLLMLCSDGVHKHGEADDWYRILVQPVSLERRCEELLELARTHGSADDATVLLLRRGGMPPPPWFGRFIGRFEAGRAGR